MENDNGVIEAVEINDDDEASLDDDDQGLSFLFSFGLYSLHPKISLGIELDVRLSFRALSTISHSSFGK